MLGAIIGDIVGSRFEFNNHRNKEFEFFASDCFVTDDSIMTLAIAKAIMETDRCITGEERRDIYSDARLSLLEDMSIKYMRELGHKYPDSGYGSKFFKWLVSSDPAPYNSFGNGAAMRVGPAGFAAKTEAQAIQLAEIVTGVTHDHEEGIKGATAVACAVFMARRGALKCEIENAMSRYYDLGFRIDDIRSSYKFNETCQETVPQSIVAFLESESFEDAIRIAISLGGDSDTLAAITGSIAEAYYGIPKDMKEKALVYLSDELRAIYDEWTLFDSGIEEKNKVLTKYIGKISAAESFGDWIIDWESDGTPENPVQIPFVDYSRLVISFVKEFYAFSYGHPDYDLSDYSTILNDRNIAWDSREMSEADVTDFDEKSVLALIMAAIRVDRFSEGALLSFIENGSIEKWLKRLKDIDWQRSMPHCQIIEVKFEVGGFFDGMSEYVFKFDGDGSVITKSSSEPCWEAQLNEIRLTPSETMEKQLTFKNLHTEYWNYDYQPIGMIVLDGTQWNLAITYSNGQVMTYEGSNAYPKNWNSLLDAFGIDHADKSD